MVTGGKFRTLMFSSTPRIFWRVSYLFLIAYQYPSLALFFLPIGLGLMVFKPKKIDLVILGALVPEIIWSGNFLIWDTYAFSLLVYVLLSLAICRGIYHFRKRKRLIIACCITLILPFFIYSTSYKTRAMQRYTDRFEMKVMVKDAFDPGEYFFNPNKTTFNEVETYVTTIFSILPEEASYYDNVYDYPIHYYYQDIRHQREDIHCPLIFPFWTT
jgi:hypothetical protein